jgi:recombination protein RecR
MQFYAEPLSRLIDELRRLPGVGAKTGQRLAFHLLAMAPADVQRLADTMVEARRRITDCSICGNLTEADPCVTCSDPSRDRSCICVVERPEDVIAMERTREYRGVYHVLGAAISPMEGVGPGDIRLAELVNRVKAGGVKEIIVATNPNTEGEVTAVYIANLLRPLGVRVSRIAHGVPVGGDLEYADEVTLARALEGRRVM